MNRPARSITDCDEVLLHMVAHFDAWLGEAHDIDFAFESGNFGGAMTDQGERRDGCRGARVAAARPILPQAKCTARRSSPARSRRSGGSARSPTSSSSPIWATKRIRGGSSNSPATASRMKWCATAAARACPRARSSSATARRAPPSSTTLPVHHASVAKHAPEVHRLHMIAEPRLAPAIPPAEHAHARIDDWPTATEWLLERLRDQ